MFQDDPFQDVGHVLAAVGGVFDRFVDLFPLEDRDGILLDVEEPGDRFLVNPVDLVLEAVDLDARLVRELLFLEERDAGDDLRRCPVEIVGHGHGFGRRALDLEEDEPVGRGFDQVDDVVEARRERVDVLPVDGRDERRVQLLDDVVGDEVSLVLDLEDLPDHPLGDLPPVHHFLEQAGPGADVLRGVDEQLEELLFSWEKPEHGSLLPRPAGDGSVTRGDRVTRGLETGGRVVEGSLVCQGRTAVPGRPRLTAGRPRDRIFPERTLLGRLVAAVRRGPRGERSKWRMCC
jgi:hypothetical protein